MLKVEKNEKILIVGGGPGSRILNHYLHMLNPDVNVTLIRDEDRIAKKCVLPCLFGVLRLLPSFEGSEGVPEEETGAQEALKFYSDRVTAHLDTLLLVRDLYEQTLIYARYHAKAAGG